MLSPVSEVFEEDCMIGMARFPDGYFDLAIVDPPYGINAPNMQMGSFPNRSRKDGFGSGPAESTAQKIKKGRLNSGGGAMKNSMLTTKSCEWDYEKPTPEYFDELKRVSLNQIIWGGNYFPLPPTRCVICWDKRQPWDNFSQWEMAWTSFDKPAPLFSMSSRGGNNHEQKIHPTQKPVKLYRWLLSKFADPGMKILDTHMGSQSSRIAAQDMGFDFYGWEIDRSYFEAGCERFRNATSQLKAFR